MAPFLSFLLIVLVSGFYAVASPLLSNAEVEKQISKMLDMNSNAFLELPGLRKSDRFDQVIFDWSAPIGTNMILDKDLGCTGLASNSGRYIARTSNELIYDMKFTNDEFGRRTSPNQKNKSADKFIAIFGCSFVFGMGVTEDQTINHFLNEKSKHYRTYNYGVPSTGTNYVLAKIQKTDFAKEIPEASGVFIYFFMTQHIQRSIGYLPSNELQRSGPYYVSDNNGNLRRDGSIESARPFYSKSLTLINKLFGNNILRGRDFPARTEKDEEYTCLLINEMSREIKNRYPKSRFVLYLHPYFEIPESFMSCIKKSGLTYIAGTPVKKVDEYIVKLDFHPNGKWNHLIADDILGFLNEH